MEVKICTSPTGECMNRKDDGECLALGECIRTILAKEAERTGKIPADLNVLPMDADRTIITIPAVLGRLTLQNEPDGVTVGELVLDKPLEEPPPAATEEKPVVTTTPPVTELKPETQAAVVEMAGKAAEMIKETAPAPAASPPPLEIVSPAPKPEEPPRPEVIPLPETAATAAAVIVELAAMEKHEPNEAPGPVELIPEKKPAAAAPVKKPVDTPRIKIVISHQNGQALVGIQREGCDPVFTMVIGSVLEASNAMPGLLISASKLWAASPKNPVAVLPAPAPAAAKPAAARQATPARPVAPAKPAAPKPGDMKSMM